MFRSSYQIEHRTMVHTSSGDITVKDILNATRHWFEHPEFHSESPVVWDIRNGHLSVSIEDMRMMYQMVRNELQEKKRTGGKTAWVHESALVRAMIDVIRLEFDWGSEWKTFASLQDAFEWTG